jgi:hypothetical protein
VENCAEVMGQLHIRGITEKHAAITKKAININTHLGEFAMHFLEEAKKWIGEVTEIALLLVALGIVAGILFGPTVPFFGQIVKNLTGLLATLGENGLVGLIAMGIILYLFQRMRAAA